MTYANSIKHSVLGVDSTTLENEGAVSEPVVRQMLSGALTRSGADIGIAVSGIAGPDGGSDDKPVGTVWLAWGTHDRHADTENDLAHRSGHVPKAGRGSRTRPDPPAVIGLAKLPHYFSRRAI